MKQYFDRLKYISKTALSVTLILLLSVLTILVAPGTSVAAELDSESISLSDPTISQTGVTYTLTVDNVTNTNIKCLEVDFTTAVGGTTLPTGMDITGITPTGTLSTGGTWTSSNPNTYTYRMVDATTGSTPAAGSNTLILSGVGNSSVKNTTYFAELNTYSDAACSVAVDSNGIAAFVNTEGVVVSAQVNPTLTFTVDSTTCDLGVLTASTTGTCSHTMTAATNASGGYTISYIPTTTLTNGASDTITETGTTGATSTQGTEQFGLNLRLNTTPVIGADPSGGSGTYSTNYGTVDTFSFNATTGAQVAEASGQTTLTTFTAAYIANVSSATEAGNYSMTQTYNIVAQY